jgi:tetratricopeptide (TPR) repeat protein
MDADKAFVLNAAAYCLQGLGRLQEAAEPMQAALAAMIGGEDWTNTSKAAANLSDLYLTIGDLPQALKLAQQSVKLADRSSDAFQRMGVRIRLANALHQMGRTRDARVAFREAEERQKQRQPIDPILYGLQGFLYCDVLLGDGQTQEVKERAAQTREIADRNNWLLEIALDNLSVSRAWLLEAQLGLSGDIARAAEFLQRAVGGLRQAGDVRHLPRGLLARAELNRATGDLDRAERDLAEALRIATRGGMGLYQADCHLESARLQLAQGKRDKAGEHWATAKEMIARMGYHRRDNEVSQLAEQLG